jgi:hypothetical protein
MLKISVYMRTDTGHTCPLHTKHSCHSQVSYRGAFLCILHGRCVEWVQGRMYNEDPLPCSR